MLPTSCVLWDKVKVGDVVLLYDEGSKLAFWKLASVNERLPGEDGPDTLELWLYEWEMNGDLPDY